MRRSFSEERLKVFSKAFRLSRSLRVRLKCYSAPTSIFYDNCLIEKKKVNVLYKDVHARTDGKTVLESECKFSISVSLLR